MIPPDPINRLNEVPECVHKEQRSKRARSLFVYAFSDAGVIPNVLMMNKSHQPPP